MDWMEQSLEMMKSWTETQRKMWEGWMSTAGELGGQQNPMTDWMTQWQKTAEQSLNAWEDLGRKMVEQQGQYASSEAGRAGWPGADSEEMKRMTESWTEQTLAMMKAWTDAQRKLWNDWFGAVSDAAKTQGVGGDWFKRWEESARASMDAWEELSRKTAETQVSWMGGQKTTGSATGSTAGSTTGSAEKKAAGSQKKS